MFLNIVNIVPGLPIPMIVKIDFTIVFCSGELEIQIRKLEI